MIIELSRTEAAGLALTVGEVYAAAFDYPDSAIATFAQSYRRCVAEYDGARVLVARTGSEIVAFAYGFTFQSGHWWPDRVLPALIGAGHQEWGQDAFELVELAVHPDHQGRGTGTALLGHLLHTTPHRRTLLGTGATNPARRLYHRTGFVDLVPGFHYSRGGPPQVIMGYDHLRAT